MDQEGSARTPEENAEAMLEKVLSGDLKETDVAWLDAVALDPALQSQLTNARGLASELDALGTSESQALRKALEQRGFNLRALVEESLNDDSRTGGSESDEDALRGKSRATTHDPADAGEAGETGEPISMRRWLTPVLAAAAVLVAALAIQFSMGAGDGDGGTTGQVGSVHDGPGEAPGEDAIDGVYYLGAGQDGDLKVVSTAETFELQWSTEAALGGSIRLTLVPNGEPDNLLVDVELGDDAHSWTPTPEQRSRFTETMTLRLEFIDAFGEVDDPPLVFSITSSR